MFAVADQLFLDAGEMLGVLGSLNSAFARVTKQGAVKF
jgi:hypothetical protein